LFSLDDVPVTTIVTVVAVLVAAALVVAYALWDLAADRLLASFGCAVVRLVTFGRVRLSAEGDFTRAMGIAVMTLLVIFVTFVIIASRVH